MLDLECILLIDYVSNFEGVERTGPKVRLPRPSEEDVPAEGIVECVEIFQNLLGFLDGDDAVPDVLIETNRGYDDVSRVSEARDGESSSGSIERRSDTT